MIDTYDDYQRINRLGWAQGVSKGWKATSAFGIKEFQHSKDLLEPNNWIPWEKIKSVLCLASGGGQQGPLFASLGYNVTVVDFSPEQLAQDQKVADEHGFNLELIESDLLDLSLLYGRDFDLVYQPLSAHHVPDVRRVYREVVKVLSPNGYYFVSHWNPIFFQLPLSDESVQWDGKAYRLVRAQKSGEIVHCKWETDNGDKIAICHFIHTLSDLIGGLCELGFVIHHFDEPKAGNRYADPESLEHIASFFPLTFNIFCSKP